MNINEDNGWSCYLCAKKQDFYFGVQNYCSNCGGMQKIFYFEYGYAFAQIDLTTHKADMALTGPLGILHIGGLESSGQILKESAKMADLVLPRIKNQIELIENCRMDRKGSEIVNCIRNPRIFSIAIHRNAFGKITLHPLTTPRTFAGRRLGMIHVQTEDTSDVEDNKFDFYSAIKNSVILMLQGF